MLFGRASPYDPTKDTADLRGKVAFVTGGNAGTGYETVKHLCQHGAKVYLAARSKQRGTEALESLRSGGALDNGGSLELLLVDLSSLKDVQRAADEFCHKEQKLHILVNNAAMLPRPERTTTPEGLTEVLATNHLSHFLLTTSLLPLLRKAAEDPNSDVRVVCVASQAYELIPDVKAVRSLDDLDIAREPSIPNAMKRYGMTKLCIIWFATELQRRFDEDGVKIIVTTADPGPIATPGSRSSTFLSLGKPIASIAWPLMSTFWLKSSAEGAVPIIYAATSKQVGEKEKAAHFMRPTKLTPLTTPASRDERLATECWSLSEKLLADVQAHGQVAEDAP